MNEVVARHELATRRQKVSEFINQYFEALKDIARKCGGQVGRVGKVHAS